MQSLSVGKLNINVYLEKHLQARIKRHKYMPKGGNIPEFRSFGYRKDKKMSESDDLSHVIPPPNSSALTKAQVDNENLATTTDPLWTINEVASYLKLQPETVRSMARRGELPGLKIGKVWRFRKSAVKKLFQE
jgi:excisionase family DNA binding protein